MAKGQKIGRKMAFHLSEAELEERIQSYKQDLKAGAFARASWAHFVDYIGGTEDQLRRFIREYSQKPNSGYYRRAMLLRSVLQFMRGQLCSAESWSGPMSSRAQMLMAQDYGDGIVYRSKEEPSQQPQVLQIRFGGDDPRGRDAAR